MKKILACLLIVVLLCSLSIMLFSCDADELKKLEYIDANGEVATVNVKKTADADKVTAAICGLASKPVDTTNLTSAMISLSAGLNISGTQNDQAFTSNATIGATVGLGIPATIAEDATFVSVMDAIKLYADISLIGNVPKNYATLFDDDSDEVPNFSELVDLNESAKVYFENNVIYAKGTVSNETLSIVPQLAMFSGLFNGEATKLDIAPLLEWLPLLNKELPENIIGAINSVHDQNNSYKKYYESLNSDDKEEGEDAAEESFDFAYADVKVLVEAFNIRITKTKGSVATFAATITPESFNKINEAFKDKDWYEPFEAEDMEGTIAVELSIDAKTMLDISLQVTIQNALAFSDTESKTNVTSSTIALTASISTTTPIPTLSQEEKDAATPMA